MHQDTTDERTPAPAKRTPHILGRMNTNKSGSDVICYITQELRNSSTVLSIKYIDKGFNSDMTSWYICLKQ